MRNSKKYWKSHTSKGTEKGGNNKTEVNIRNGKIKARKVDKNIMKNDISKGTKKKNKEKKITRTGL